MAEDTEVKAHNIVSDSLSSCMRTASDWLFVHRHDISEERVWDVSSHRTDEGNWEMTIYYYLS